MPLSCEPSRLTPPARSPAPGAGWLGAAGLVLLLVLLLGGCSHWPAPGGATGGATGDATGGATAGSTARGAVAGPAAAASAAAGPFPPAAAAARASPTPAAPTPAEAADAAARRLLAFHERVRELPVAELAREQARLDAARQGLEAGDADTGAGITLELALVLAQTRQNGDLARALGLVEPLTRAGAPPRWQPLARLLQARLAEQRRLEEQAERQAQQLRDQQRRIEQLSSQLEALKAIERSLNTRALPGGGAAPTPTPGPAATPAPARTP